LYLAPGTELSHNSLHFKLWFACTVLIVFIDAFQFDIATSGFLYILADLLCLVVSCDIILYVQDDMDKRIRELTNELESANRKCEVYRANLLSVLKDIEDHKQQLSIKVQNIKISMKDGL
jgi:hypothetical protein